MTVIYVLIALSLTIAVGFLIAFLWAVRTGQFDDTHTPAMRVLFEDTKKTSQISKSPNKHPESKANVPNRPRSPGF